MTKRFGDFELDTMHAVLRARGRTVDLPPMAIRTLVVLVDHADSVVSKEQLMDALWPDGFVEEGNLTQYIYLLRKALRAHGAPGAIETHARRGYSFKLPPTLAAQKRRPRRWIPALTAALLALMCFTRASVAPAPDPETSRLYALGRYYWNLRSVEGMQRSIGYFERVIARAPDRALGYAGLADAYTELADFQRPCAQCDAWERRAEFMAQQALRVEPQSSEAHASAAMIARVSRGDDMTAERELRAAIALDGDNALAHQWLGNLLVAHGRLDEARRELEIAAARQPVATATVAWLARALYYERDYAAAEQYAREALQLQPTRLETTILLVLIQQARGEYAEALRSTARVASLGERVQAQVLRAGVYGSMGEKHRALALLHRVAPAAQSDAYASRQMAISFAAMGERAQAREQLRRARYTSALDRELIRLDPNVAALRVH